MKYYCIGPALPFKADTALGSDCSTDTESILHVKELLTQAAV
jgi:hypothetical protein